MQGKSFRQKTSQSAREQKYDKAWLHFFCIMHQSRFIFQPRQTTVYFVQSFSQKISLREITFEMTDEQGFF